MPIDAFGELLRDLEVLDEKRFQERTWAQHVASQGTSKDVKKLIHPKAQNGKKSLRQGLKAR